MAWLSLIKGRLAGVTWWPHALIGLAAVVSTASGLAYMKGYGAAEKNYLTQMNRVLASQLERTKSLYQKDIVIVTQLVETENDIEDDIDSIPDPVGGVGSDDWVRAYNAAVRAAARDTATAD